MLEQIDHVGIAVPDLETAVERYRETFGVAPAHRERVESQGVEEVLFRVGVSYIAAGVSTTSPTASRTSRPPSRR
jgi:methylmalonyl-CoA/ethylmalonyl-CoA epimerase